MPSTFRTMTRLGAGLMVVLGLTGCGTRVDQAERLRSEGPNISTDQADASLAEPSRSQSPSEEQSAVTAPGGASAAAPSGAQRTTATPRSAPAQSSAGRSGNPQAERAATNPSASGRSPGGGPASGSASDRPVGGKSPGTGSGSTVPVAAVGGAVVIGNVGTYSGPVGSSLSSGPKMLQVWAKWVNQRGGVAGHAVEVVISDDGGDPARNVASHKDLVENRHVVAFVGNLAPTTAQAAVSYLEAKKVPVIGGDMSDPVWNRSPMLFPQGPAGPSLYAALAKGAATTGKKKLGLVYCAEAQVCQGVYQTLFRDGAVQKAGMEPTYSVQASLTQPDFTAECLQARNRGVEVLVVMMDANSVGRVADSCTRQSFRPAYVSGGLIVTSQLASNANLDGLLSVMPTFSWVASGTPATDEYQQALKQLAPNLTPSASTSAVWASGQLFATAMGLRSDETPAGILHGLWQIRGESLGGLVVPLTFEANKPAPPVDCYFITQARERKWVAFNDGRPSC